MKFEHTLSPAAVQVFRAGVEELNKQRLEYLRALGLAKETEMRSATLQETLSQQVTVIQQMEGLPVPLTPYQLNADCTKLVGEVADKPAAAPAPAIVTPAEPGNVTLINGADHV